MSDKLINYYRIEDWVGISPKKFLQYLTLDYLRNKIKETKNMIEAADLAGLSSQSQVHDLFVTIEGMSPQQYKTAGRNMLIHYGYHASPFGLCFIAVTGTKVCALKFIDEEFSRPPNGEDLQLLVKGTPFQLKVWEALSKYRLVR